MFLSAAGLAWSASPWLPSPGGANVSVFYITDSFRDFRYGSAKAMLAEPFRQNTLYTVVEYGLRRNIAIDVETGYTSTSVGKIGIPGLADVVPRQGLGGVADSNIGLRWQVWGNERWSATVRAAAIIKGSYDLSRTSIFSPGDKASGGLGSFLLGASLPHGFFTFHEIGFRARQNPVPNDFFGTFGFGHAYRRFQAIADYQTSRSVNGSDIFSPGFRLIDFPSTKKIYGAMDASVSYSITPSVALNFHYGHILHGRNFGMKRIYSTGISFTLPAKGPHMR